MQSRTGIRNPRGTARNPRGNRRRQSSGPTLVSLAAFKATLGATRGWEFGTARATSGVEPQLVSGSGMTVSAGSLALAGSAPTPYGAAVDLSSVAARIEATTGYNFPVNADFTVGFWMKTSDLMANQALFGQASASNDYWMLQLRDSNNLRWQLDDTSIVGARFSATGCQLPDNGWHYVHAWRQFNVISASDSWGVAVNAGSAVTTTRNSFSGGSTPQAGQAEFATFHIASAPNLFGNQAILGGINHFWIYNKVLSAGERTADYDAERLGV